LATIAAGLSTGLVHAQGQGSCATDEMRQRMIAQNPDLLRQEAEAEHGLQAYLQAKAGLRDDADTTTYIIPVVFHILYDPSFQENSPTANLDAHNITDAQVFDQMNILNRDYAKLNADTSTICCGFNTRAANIRVRFQLATKDPFGNCTNGIDRITTQRSSNAGDYSKLHSWFRDRYLNVWSVRTFASLAGGFEPAGYSQYPSDVQDAYGALRDGVILLHDYLGSTGTSSVGHSRDLTHEVGHYLNLQHPWGNNNGAGEVCGDDGVADTPITKGWLYCPDPADSHVCDSDSAENYQNYMDYSYCSVMFTKGQRDRMRAALESDISGRNDLWQDSNHSFTGTAGYEQTCGPQADFYTVTPFVCTNTPVQFKDNSTRAVPTSWAWSFEGGTPATSTDQNPTVTFADPGAHTVTLTCGNDHGSSSVTKEHSIQIGPGWSEVDGLLNESFDNLNAFQTWPNVNYENNNSYWGWNNQVGHYAPGCAKLNASDTYTLVQDGFVPNGFADKDLLLSPTMDLSLVSSIQLSFWYAYASRTSTSAEITESLQIYSSTDCGKDWLLRKTLSGPELVTAGIASAGYTPDAGDWRQVTVALPPTLKTNHVRIKFEYTSGLLSNDIFLDDVNIGGTVGIHEQEQSVSMTLMPNPATDHLTITLDLGTANEGTLDFLDMTGRTIHEQAVNGGEQQLEFDLPKMGIRSGVYLVRLKDANGQRIARLVVR
jgi:hypothetical protein